MEKTGQRQLNIKERLPASGKKTEIADHIKVYCTFIQNYVEKLLVGHHDELVIFRVQNVGNYYHPLDTLNFLYMDLFIHEQKQYDTSK
jgi:hypothetical protein